ncbi:MAG: metal-dependent hydrolase [Rhizobiales bacterium]|nr:metal-dependent hydrolase [Hyphomicrobiales bacterium]
MRITWYGHSCFKLETADDRLLIDPFLTGNPTAEAAGVASEAASAGVTHVLLTHGHDDHVGDTVAIAKRTGATVVANYELALHLMGQGVEKVEMMNPGGEIDLGSFRVAMTNAVHSSSTAVDGRNQYLGVAAGLVVTPREGPVVYHMGDTAVTADFAIVEALYRPRVGLVPIGDRFTMGAKAAAYACKTYFSFSTVVPCHYGTFPIIDRTADAFVKEMTGKNVVVPKVGVAFDV